VELFEFLIQNPGSEDLLTLPCYFPGFCLPLPLKILKMLSQYYETVFILTPVLSEAQMKDAVEKFRKFLADNGAEIINVENWGLRKLAYPIIHKSTGFYNLLEFKAPTSLIAAFEVEFKRDERVMRFLTVSLDKDAIEYNDKRRKGTFNKKTTEAAAAAKVEKEEA
jgi:small subunit ribosomal protein S6